MEEQNKLPKSVDPVLTVQTISMKHSSIEREVFEKIKICIFLF